MAQSSSLTHAIFRFLAVLCFGLMVALPAHADGKRKVTKYEYDSVGRPVKVQVYDDVGEDAELVAQTETQYDELSNVVLERQIATPYDRSKVYNYQSYLAYDDGDHRNMLEQRYEYEDSKWPKKVTKKYNSRVATWDQAYQDKWARQYYYNEVTGQLELEFGSTQYCLELGSTAAETFEVRRSGVKEYINIRNFDRCSAKFITYDNLGRVSASKVSQALSYFDKANLEDRAWLETSYTYYPVGGQLNAAQKGGLHKVKTLGATEAESRTSTFEWDAVGNLISVKDNAGNETIANYDAKRQILGNEDPTGKAVQYAYDNAGQLRAVSNKIGENEWAISRADYFATGQIQTLTDPDGDIIQYAYDPLGRLDVMTDPAGRKSKVKYFPNGQTQCKILAYDTPLQQAYAAYEYGPDGQVKTQRPAKGSDPLTCEKLTSNYDTTMVYDEYRRLFETVFPARPEDAGASYASNGHSYSREWRDRGGVIYQTRTRAGDLIKQYTDANGHNYIRLTKEADYRFANYGGTGAQNWASISPKKDGASPSSFAWTDYDLTKRRYVQMTFGGRGEALGEYTRDGYGSDNLSPEIFSTKFYYDAVDNLTRQHSSVYNYGHGEVQPHYANRAQSRYEYDQSGAMLSAFFSSTGSSANEIPVAQFEYDAAGRMLSHIFGDGNKINADGSAAHARQTYTFDADSDLKKKQHEWAVAGQSTLGGFSHLFDQDASGKIDKAVADSQAWQYSPPEHTETYSPANLLDQYGNVDLGDGFGVQNYTYDGSGNLTSDGAGRTYVYNSENQMVKALGTGLHMEYRYDAIGRRSHSIDYVLGEEIFHSHVGQMEIGDYRVTREGESLGTGRILSHTALTKVIIGASIDQRLAFYHVAGDELTFPMTNHQGSTIAIVSDTGERLADGSGGKFVYGPYGQETSGASDAGYPYRYTGRRLDVQTGLYYYRARYYSAETGRFLQTDPIGTADQMNLYAYVGNDPLNGTDPSGKIRCEGIAGCSTVYARADSARKALSDKKNKLDSLRSAVREGGKLSVSQQETKTQYESQYGEGSATSRNLRRTSKKLSKLHKKIGAPGKGIKVNVHLRDNSLGAQYSSSFFGINETIDIYNLYFSKSSAMQSYLLSHEAGHGIGLSDVGMPDEAPAGLGEGSPFYGGVKAYGNGASKWLAIHKPDLARKNNDNLQCFTFEGACGR